MEFLFTDNGNQPALLPIFGISKNISQQLLSMPLLFVSPGNPETTNMQVVGGGYRNPGVFRRTIFDENLGAFIEASKDIAILEFIFQPRFLELVTLFTFLIRKSAANMFLFNSFSAQVDIQCLSLC